MYIYIYIPFRPRVRLRFHGILHGDEVDGDAKPRQVANHLSDLTVELHHCTKSIRAHV